jgi:predicted ArsR family transcriptional regulator
MKEELNIREAKLVRLFTDPTKQAIVELCVREPRSIDQLAKVLKKNPGLIHYHLQPLLKHKLLILHSTRPARGMTEKKYIAAAKRFRVELEAGGESVTATSLKVSHVFRGVRQTLRRLEESAADEAFSQDFPVLGYRMILPLSAKAQQELAKQIQKLVKAFADRRGTKTDKLYGLAIGFGPMKSLDEDEEDQSN